MFGYDAIVKGYRHDPQKARQLLAEAGYPDGLEITLESPTGRYQGDKEIAEALGGQWQKAGFKPKVQVAEWGAYFKRYLGKQFQDAYLLGLGGPMQDGDELYNLVSSKGRGLYYKNDKIDTLFDLGRSTMDPAARRKIYADLARTMVEDATWVFLRAAGGHLRARDRLGVDAARRPVDVVHVRDAEVAASQRQREQPRVHGREAPGVGGHFGAPQVPHTRKCSRAGWRRTAARPARSCGTLPAPRTAPTARRGTSS